MALAAAKLLQRRRADTALDVTIQAQSSSCFASCRETGIVDPCSSPTTSAVVARTRHRPGHGTQPSRRWRAKVETVRPPHIRNKPQVCSNRSPARRTRQAGRDTIPARCPTPRDPRRCKVPPALPAHAVSLGFARAIVVQRRFAEVESAGRGSREVMRT